MTYTTTRATQAWYDEGRKCKIPKTMLGTEAAARKGEVITIMLELRDSQETSK